jgi:hypothetical protein
MQLIWIALQIAILLFLLIHDWIPLGALNDIPGVKSQNSTARNAFNTAVNCIPVLIGLILSILYYLGRYPLATMTYLLFLYLLLLVGELRAWWIPYFFGTTEERVKRYKAMFGQTHSFLPERNGIVPNTAHVLLHVATLLAFVFTVVIALQQLL